MDENVSGIIKVCGRKKKSHLKLGNIILERSCLILSSRMEVLKFICVITDKIILDNSY